ncbi:MAG: hypothetical protein QXO51_01230 [Halobacteria archaeon]
MKLPIRKIDLAFLLSLAGVGLLALYLFGNPEAGRALSLGQWRDWTQHLKSEALGTALLVTVGITLLGNISPFPSPYILAVFFLSEPPAEPWFPAFVAAVASIGAFFGESVGYLIGAGIRRVAAGSKKVQELQSAARVRPRLMYFLIFIMAVTPLPDKVVMIPAGIAGFRFRYAVTAMWLGKLTLLLAVAYGAFYYGRSLLRVFGPEESWVSGVATIIAILAILYLLFRLDWGRIAARLGRKSA